MPDLTPQADLCLRVTMWLEDRGCTTTITRVDHEFHIHYTLKLDMKPQPALRITNKPSVIVPKGSQFSVILAMMDFR